MSKGNILFFAYNSHQSKYFNFLAKKLTEQGYKTYCLKDSEVFIKALIKLFSSKKELTEKEINQLKQFSYLKFKTKFKKSRYLHCFYRKFLKCKARLYEKFFLDFYDEKKLDLVIVWNGSNLDSKLAAKLAKNPGIKTLYMETGQFPNTLEIDNQGVNAASSLIAKSHEFFSQVEVEKDKLAEIHQLEIETRELRSDGLLKKFKQKEIKNSKTIKLPDKFIFLPFQVHTDSQVLINSPRINDMYELLDFSYQAVKKFNQRNNENYYLVVKEHPSDFGRIDYSDLKKEYKEKNVIFITEYEVFDLIAASSAVITLNSSVGIEALLQYKAVITLGEANYNVSGVVNNVNDLAKLDQAIERAIYNEVNTEMIDKFLYYFRFKYLVTGNKSEPSEENNREVLKKIKTFL